MHPETLAETHFRPQSAGQSKSYDRAQRQWGGDVDSTQRGILQHITVRPLSWHVGMITPLL